MSLELPVALVVFVVATLFTPGPNNIMLMTSGVNFGFRRSLPHALGVAFGFCLMVLLVGLGLGAVFLAHPLIHRLLTAAGVVYLLYLAWKIAVAGPIGEGEAPRGRPMSFLGAAAFQWVNPKGWAMAVGAVASYAAILDFPMNMILIAGLFGAFGFLSSWTWLGFGSALRPLLRNPLSVRIFNIAMALAMVISLVPVLVKIV